MPKIKPHPSHKMGEWKSTIVTLTETPRFGKIRKCVNCGAEQAHTVAGDAMHDQLHRPCVEVPVLTDEV